MKCMWKELLGILPASIRQEADKYGREAGQEIRLRRGLPARMVLPGHEMEFGGVMTEEDLQYVISAASAYSPWASPGAARGYLTAAGGHRIGICGEAILKEGKMTGIRSPTSLCIRVARDFPGLAEPLRDITGSILLVGPPGSGKTPLLRDLIRQRPDHHPGSISVVDERGELFPVESAASFPRGSKTDILTGCGKKQALDCLLRTMSPGCIAVDEITEESDCDALIRASRCGVSLLATVHAGSLEELDKRPVYRTLLSHSIFETAVILTPDKSFRAERIRQWSRSY